MTTPAPVRARIASMSEPLPEDRANALIVAVYDAREHLSNAENVSTGVGFFDEGIENNENAIRCLDAAIALLPNVKPENGDSARSMFLVERAHLAAEGALASGRHARTYHVDVVGKAEWDEKYAATSKTIWHKSTQVAKQETHRALAELAERFPSAYDREDDPVKKRKLLREPKLRKGLVLPPGAPVLYESDVSEVVDCKDTGEIRVHSVGVGYFTLVFRYTYISFLRDPLDPACTFVRHVDVESEPLYLSHNVEETWLTKFGVNGHLVGEVLMAAFNKAQNHIVDALRDRPIRAAMMHKIRTKEAVVRALAAEGERQ